MEAKTLKQLKTEMDDAFYAWRATFRIDGFEGREQERNAYWAAHKAYTQAYNDACKLANGGK